MHQSLICWDITACCCSFAKALFGLIMFTALLLFITLVLFSLWSLRKLLSIFWYHLSSYNISLLLNSLAHLPLTIDIMKLLFFLQGRGQGYWQDEKITEEIPSCRQMFNIFHPFDPVAYRFFYYSLSTFLWFYLYLLCFLLCLMLKNNTILYVNI